MCISIVVQKTHQLDSTESLQQLLAQVTVHKSISQSVCCPKCGERAQRIFSLDIALKSFGCDHCIMKSTTCEHCDYVMKVCAENEKVIEAYY